MILPFDDVEKQEVLSEIMKKFDEGKNYTEIEVYGILKNLGIGDFALFARELVNFGYFNKDSYKSIYWVRKKKLSNEEIEKIKNWGD